MRLKRDLFVVCHPADGNNNFCVFKRDFHLLKDASGFHLQFDFSPALPVLWISNPYSLHSIKVSDSEPVQWSFQLIFCRKAFKHLISSFSYFSIKSNGLKGYRAQHDFSGLLEIDKNPNASSITSFR